MRRLAGIAGLGYVIGAAIENMEILEAPTLTSPVADVRAAYSDQALAAVTSAAGAVALVAYCVFVVALVRFLRDRAGHGRWSVAALVGGFGGPALAAAGLVATSMLVANGTADLSDDRVTDLFDFYLHVRIVSGVFVAMFVAGVGVAALRARALPPYLAWFACALAVPMALAPLAAFVDGSGLELAVRIAFACQTLWIFATSLWLTLADGVGVATFIRRAAFLLLVVAAGLIGIALVAVPGATGEFFAWGLGPEPLAAFAGGVYIGSAAAYAVALPRGEREVRGLVLGAAVLSVSVFAITLAHLDQFDFDRLQAWAWVALFAGFSVVMVGLFATGAHGSPEQPAEALAAGIRLTLAGVSVVLGAAAAALWIDPSRLADLTPYDLPPLGGRFAGSWVALLSVLAGWAALRNRADEARLSAVALVTLPAGAVIAALRTLQDLDPAGTAAAYIAAIVLVLATGAVVLALPSTRGWPRPTHGSAVRERGP
jgi:hypothetical protein